MANAAIGSRISLISKSEIRYEGFLDHINTEQNHVGLKNVRMFGTEGRKGGANEVPASENLYEFIIFRGGDIKDLSVFENQPRDPAIVNSKSSNIPASSQEPMSKSAWANGPPTAMRGGASAGPSHHHNNRNDNQQQQRTYGNGRDGGNYQQQQRTYGNGRDGGNYSQNRDNNNNNNGGGYSRGGYNNNNNNGGGRGGYHNQGAGGAPRPVQHTGQDFQVSADPARARNEVGTNFDFSKAQNDFERAKQEARNNRQQQQQNGGARIEKYEKKDFFDKLSADDKKNQPLDFHSRRMEREHQNANDTETFGRDMVADQSTRGFGRGRGGRGGGYRGGRGYHNNNNRGGRGQF